MLYVFFFKSTSQVGVIQGKYIKSYENLHHMILPNDSLIAVLITYLSFPIANACH